MTSRWFAIFLAFKYYKPSKQNRRPPANAEFSVWFTTDLGALGALSIVLFIEFCLILLLLN